MHKHDDLEYLRHCVESNRIDGVEFVRYAEASFEIRGRRARVWVRGPCSRNGMKWIVGVYGKDRLRFDTVEEVLEWLQRNVR